MSRPARAHLLSLDEWWESGEDREVRVELQEGVRIVAPRPRPAHARVVLSLATQLSDQLPPGFEVLIEVDVVIDPNTPATVRVPDIIVRSTTSVEFPITADQLALAIEVMSPGSRRTDRVTKSSEYAEAGIPHYWIVDEDLSVTALELTPGGYVATGFVGDIVTSTPWPMRISLER